MKNLSLVLIAIFVVGFVFIPAAFGQTVKKQNVAIVIENFPDELQMERVVAQYYKSSPTVNIVDRRNESVDKIIRVRGNLDNRSESRIDYNQRRINRNVDLTIFALQRAYDETVKYGNKLTKYKVPGLVDGGAYAFYHSKAEKERAKIQPENYDEIRSIATVSVEWIDPRREIVVDKGIGSVTAMFERRYIRDDGTYVVVGDDSLGSYGVHKGAPVIDRDLQWLLELAFAEAQKKSSQTIGR